MVPQLPLYAGFFFDLDPNLPITSELHCFEYQEIFDHQTPCLSNECGREFANNGREPYTINADGQRYRSGCAADGVGDVVLSFRECNLEEETVTYGRVNIILFQCIDKC